MVLIYLPMVISLQRLYKQFLNTYLQMMSAGEIAFKHFSLTEELQKQLVEQVELRKKLEREFQSLKGIFPQAYNVIFMTQCFSLAFLSFCKSQLFLLMFRPFMLFQQETHCSTIRFFSNYEVPFSQR